MCLDLSQLSSSRPLRQGSLYTGARSSPSLLGEPTMSGAPSAHNRFPQLQLLPQRVPLFCTCYFNPDRSVLPLIHPANVCILVFNSSSTTNPPSQRMHHLLGSCLFKLAMMMMMMMASSKSICITMWAVSMGSPSW